MLDKNNLKNINVYLKSNYYNLTSWNYGSYFPLNPFYKTHINFPPKSISTINHNISIFKKINSILEKVLNSLTLIK